MNDSTQSSTAEAVEKHLKEIHNRHVDGLSDTSHKSEDKPPLEDMSLTGIVNDKRLAELLKNCDDFLQNYANLQDKF